MSLWNILPAELQEKIMHYKLMAEIREAADAQTRKRQYINRCPECNFNPADGNQECEECFQRQILEQQQCMGCAMHTARPNDDLCNNCHALSENRTKPVISISMNIGYEKLLGLSEYMRPYGVVYCGICTQAARIYKKTNCIYVCECCRLRYERTQAVVHIRYITKSPCMYGINIVKRETIEF